MCHDSQGNTAPQAGAGDLQLHIDDPALITAAQQYNMNAKVGGGCCPAAAG
jgi:hypothetical protein